jgi:hypothetical protein
MTKTRNIHLLIDYIERRTDGVFNWSGSRDCVAFAARCVLSVSGVDARGSLRWSSKREAKALIDAEGGLEKAMDGRLSRTPIALAMRGDVAAVADAEMGIRLMIVEGATLVGPGSNRLERLPRSEMIIAWDAMSAGSADV